MESIIGHDKILDFFDKTTKAGNLSHAYLFVGQKGVGKTTVAEFLAKQLLEVENLATSPDFHFTEQLFDEKTGKTKKNITIAQMRELREYLSRSSYSGGYKISIINNAEKMNKEAANGLLKTLEEPSKKTILFLLTPDENLLPETIQSRCQMVYFHPVQKKLIEKFLLDSDLSADEAEAMSRLSTGLPGLAKRWLVDNEEYEWHKTEVLRFADLSGKTFHEKISRVEELFGDKTDHIATRDKLIKVLNIWQVLLRDGFLSEKLVEQKIHKIQGNLDNVQTAKTYSIIEEAKNLLNQNIHPRLVVENILLNIN